MNNLNKKLEEDYDIVINPNNLHIEVIQDGKVEYTFLPQDKYQMLALASRGDITLPHDFEQKLAEAEQRFIQNDWRIERGGESVEIVGGTFSSFTSASLYFKEFDNLVTEYTEKYGSIDKNSLESCSEVAKAEAYDKEKALEEKYLLVYPGQNFELHFYATPDEISYFESNEGSFNKYIKCVERDLSDRMPEIIRASDEEISNIFIEIKQHASEQLFGEMEDSKEYANTSETENTNDDNDIGDNFF